MGSSAPEAVSLQELLSLANHREMKLWNELSLGYSSNQGHLALRESIAATYPDLTSANIITFAGAQEAIFVAYHALLKANDRVHVILPIFEPLSLVAQGVGARLDTVHLTPIEDGGWYLDIDQWHDAIDKNTAMAVINFPHNPTGKLIQQDELAMMVEHCARNDCWLFSDEVFRGLEYRPSERLLPVASLYRKGISLGVMSKAYGLGGIRVGWLACQDHDLIKRMLEIKHYLSICNGRADELLAMIALRQAAEILQRTQSLIEQNLKLLKSKLDSVSSILHWHAPEAGCIAYPRLVAEQNSQDFAKRLLDRTGVMIIPGACFMWGDTHIRIGFGRRDFPQSLQRFLPYLN